MMFGKRCSTCGRRYRGDAEMMNHVQNAHGAAGYDCKRCGTIFPSMEEMRTHLQKEHRFTKA